MGDERAAETDSRRSYPTVAVMKLVAEGVTNLYAVDAQLSTDLDHFLVRLGAPRA